MKQLNLFGIVLLLSITITYAIPNLDEINNPESGFSDFFVDVTNLGSNLNVTGNLTVDNLVAGNISAEALNGIVTLLLDYHNITGFPTCSGTDKLTFDGNDLNCEIDLGGGGASKFLVSDTYISPNESSTSGINVINASNFFINGTELSNYLTKFFQGITGIWDFADNATFVLRNDTIIRAINISSSNILEINQLTLVNPLTPGNLSGVINTTTSFGGEVTGTYDSLTLSNTALDDQYTRLGDGWSFDNNDSLVLDNGSIIRTGNVSQLFSERNNTLWNISGNNIFPKEIGNRVGINTSDPSHSLEVLGDVLFNFSGVDHFEIHADGISDDVIFIEIEPTVPGQSIIHAEVETDGIADVRFITLDYLVTLVSEQFASAINLNFDVSGSTGGSIDAILVNQLGEGDNTAEVHALSVEHGVNVIFQESGESVNADVYILNSTSGSQNITGNATTNSGDLPFNIEMFSSKGDTLMIGHDIQYSDIEFLLNESASNPGIKPVFEHSIAGGWKTFTPSDGTRGFRDSGLIRYELADVGPDWVASEENNQTKFWIKIERTQGGGGLNPPIESLMDVVTTVIFEWDDLGDVFINNLNLTGDIRYQGDNITLRGSTGQIEIFGTPDSDASFSAFAVFSNTSRDPELRIHSRGVGRSVHSLMSLKVSQNLGHLCSVETDIVDCDGSASGADLVVNDDVWYGGSGFFSNATFNISDEGNLVTSGTANFTAGLRYFDGPVECPTGTFMSYTNGTTAICVSAGTVNSSLWNITQTNITPRDAHLNVSIPPFFVDVLNDRVGIGISNPSQKLDVSGSVKVTDTYLFFDGTTQTTPGDPNPNSWFLTSATFKQNFSVSSIETNPQDIFFKPDGLKMYVPGVSSGNVSEFNLSTAWDVSTATFKQGFSAITTPILGMFFRIDGKKLYFASNTGDKIDEYDLTIAWDVSTATHKQAFTASESVNVNGIFFKPDGLSMYVTSNTGPDDEINEYTLSIPWDVSTSNFKQVFNLTKNPTETYFKPDGTRMYTVGSETNNVQEYILSTPWDISTASSNDVFDASEDGINRGLFFKSDGTKMYIAGNTADSVYEYNLGFIIEEGNVGIGTTSPTEKLEIRGNFTVNNIDSGGVMFFVDATNNRTSIGQGNPDVELLLVGDQPTFIIEDSRQLSLFPAGHVINLSFFTGDTSGGGRKEIAAIKIMNDAPGRTTPEGEMAFFTATAATQATEKVRIDNDGNVGIGTTSPAQKLTVAGNINLSSNSLLDVGTTGSQWISSELTVTNSNVGQDQIISLLNSDDTNTASGARFIIQSGGTSAGDPFIRFGVGTTQRIAMGLDNDDGDKFKISDSNTLGSNDRFVIDSSGNIGIGTTSPNLKLEVIGAGRFSGALNATSLSFPEDFSNVNNNNTLDDYEEGAFSPGIADDTGDGSGEGQEYEIQYGRYTKIGNRVLFNLRIKITNLGTLTTSEDAQITGLPFTATSDTSGEIAVSVGFGISLSLPSAGQSLTGFVNIGTKRIPLYLWDATTGTTALKISELSVDSILMVAGHYNI